MLDREQRHQQEINDNCLHRLSGGSGVNRLRHSKAGDEADCVDNRDCEREIGHDAIEKRDKFSHEFLLSSSVYVFGGSRGTAADTNSESLLGGSGSRGGTKA